MEGWLWEPQCHHSFFMCTFCLKWWESILRCLLITVFLIHNIHYPKLCHGYCFRISPVIKSKYNIQSLIVPLHQSRWKLYIGDGVTWCVLLKFAVWRTNKARNGNKLLGRFYFEMFNSRRSGNICLCLFLPIHRLANESFQFADLGRWIIVLSLCVLLGEKQRAVCGGRAWLTLWMTLCLYWLLLIICFKTKWVTWIHKSHAKHSLSALQQPFCAVWLGITNIFHLLLVESH